jgi:hypothetical protein
MLNGAQIEPLLDPLRVYGEWCGLYSIVVGVVGDFRTVSERPASAVLAESNFLRSLIDQSESLEDYRDTIEDSVGTVLCDFAAVGPVLHVSSESVTPRQIVDAIRSKAFFGIGEEGYGSVFLLSTRADPEEKLALSIPSEVLRKFVRESCVRAEACGGSVLVVLIPGGDEPSPPREWRRGFYDSMGFAFYDEALE